MIIHTIPDEMHSEVSFALSCYLDDFEKDIKKQEKASGQKLTVARASHAKREQQ